MENTDFVIEHIDKEVKVITDRPSSVVNYPANTDFFIENIDDNVISIAHSLNIEASEVEFRPANTDFFIENIDNNVKEISESLELTPSEVSIRPANTDFFVENIDKNLIAIAEYYDLEPSRVVLRPANTDMFIENIDRNVTLIKSRTNVITKSGSFINVDVPDGGTMQLTAIDGNATQNGTPTPDAPVPISTVTGAQNINVTGKNLFDKDMTPVGAWHTTKETTQSGIELTSTASGGVCYVYYELPFKHSESVDATVSFQKTGSGFVNIYFRDENNNATKSTSNQTSTFSLSGISSTTTKVQIYFYGDTSESGKVTTYDNIQLELGSTATAYEPYQGQSYPISLGNIELAKIGNYQDRIYKNGGKWYIEKQVGKVVLDGSESYAYYSNYGGFRYQNANFNISSANPSEDLICSHFTVATVRGILPTAPVIKTYTQSADSTYIFLCDGTSDVDAFKTWLSTHPTTVYYALATPTTTEITDETLLEQLNFIADMYEGINNISFIGTGAQGTIEVVINKD